MAEQAKFGVVRSAESERRRVSKNPVVRELPRDKFSLTSQNVANILWLAVNSKGR